MEQTQTEKIFRFQPTDDEGRPIGGEQVIKYTTEEELRDKLREQNVLLIRKLRQETKKNRLGILEQEQLPDDVQRFDEPVSFNPRELSEEERYEIARKLIDPTTAAEATQALVEATIGGPLSSIGSELRSLRTDSITLKAQLEAEAFARETPDYYLCDDNAQTITAWILRYKLAPTKANFKLAFENLKEQGALILGPAIEPVVPPPPVIESPATEVIREQIPQQEIQRPPSGLTRENSSSEGIPASTGSDIVYEYMRAGQHVKLTGLDAVRAMPSEEYKRRLLVDKNFGKAVDKLESESRTRRG
jgi:hypothetical protein